MGPLGYGIGGIPGPVGPTGPTGPTGPSGPAWRAGFSMGTYNSLTAGGMYSDDASLTAAFALGSESFFRVMVPGNTSIRGIVLQHAVAGPLADTTFTVLLNGVATALSVTIPAASLAIFEAIAGAPIAVPAGGGGISITWSTTASDAAARRPRASVWGF